MIASMHLANIGSFLTPTFLSDKLGTPLIFDSSLFISYPITNLIDLISAKFFCFCFFVFLTSFICQALTEDFLGTEESKMNQVQLLTSGKLIIFVPYYLFSIPLVTAMI